MYILRKEALQSGRSTANVKKVGFLSSRDGAHNSRGFFEAKMGLRILQVLIGPKSSLVHLVVRLFHGCPFLSVASASANPRGKCFRGRRMSVRSRSSRKARLQQAISSGRSMPPNFHGHARSRLSRVFLEV